MAELGIIEQLREIADKALEALGYDIDGDIHAAADAKDAEMMRNYMTEHGMTA